MKEKASVVLFERIERCIYLVRGQKVMLSTDLAALYGVEPRVLVQAVKRNSARFPIDFMFQLAPEEFADLKSQTVISSWGGSRTRPYAFTEQGVAMLSSVLNSRQAIEVNIAIIRAFVRLRQFLASQAHLGKKLCELEEKVESHHESIHVLFEAIHQLTSERPPAIGFQYVDADEDETGGHEKVRERKTRYRTRGKQSRPKKGSVPIPK